MNKLILLLLLSFSAFDFYSQGISFFNDYLGNVLIFNNGEIKQIEHQPFRSYKTGNNYLAYEDNAGSMKIYHNNYVHKLSSFASDYKTSDYLAGLRINTLLKVFDNGEVQTLSFNINNFYLNDDIVVWFDTSDKMLKCYYNAQIFELDDALATGIESNKVKVGENTVIYVNSQGYQNIFYQNKIEELCHAERIKSIDLGRDIVAYVEAPLNSFKVFYYGSFIEVENFEPQSYKLGDGLVAYIDENQSLKVFYNFKKELISLVAPDFYEVTDELIVFAVQNHFNVWYNNNIYTLETGFIPTDYKMNNNVLAYLDQKGNLKFFDGTSIKTISYEKIRKFELHGSILKYAFGVNSENIYFNDKMYKND